MNINDALAKEYNRGLANGKASVKQKHGHWIRKGGLKRAGEPEAHCSNCGRPVSYYIDEKNTYQFDKWCAGCGAKMDEVTK